jgi:DNA repair protein RadC
LAADQAASRTLLANLVRPIAGAEADSVAALLLETFGNLRSVLAADHRTFHGPELARCSLCHLRHVEEVLLQSLREPLVAAPLFDTGERVVDYLRCAMGHLRGEQVRVLYLDGSFSLLKDEVVSAGSATSVQFAIETVARRALLLDAHGLIVAHNHPSGRLDPSEADLKATRQLAQLCRLIDVALVDHVIVTRTGAVSLRDKGLL